MQGTSFNDESNASAHEKFPRIENVLLKLDTTIYDLIDTNDFGRTMMKNVAGGTYDGERVIMMQISGTASLVAKQRAFKENLRFCITSSRPDQRNIARFIGGTDPSDLHTDPFVLFHDSEGIDHEQFLRINKSPKALFKFLGSAQEGSRFVYSRNIKHRDCIKVSPSGNAVVYPSGILLSKFSGRNSTKRSVRHILRDVGRSNPALPLQAIYEVLLASTTASQAKAIEQALINTDPESLNDLTLWRIADTLQLPLTRELHYHGPEPEFTLSVGDSGQPVPSPLGEDLNEANALIRFQNWHHRKKSSKGSTRWQSHLCTRAMRLHVITPYFLDGVFQQGLDAPQGWVRYDNVLKDVEDNRTNMCLLYNTENGRSSPADSESGSSGDDGPSFTVRSICVRVRFDIPDVALLPQQTYFHRRPDPSAAPREYWGFISDNKNPLVTPSYKLQDIPLRYEIHVKTSMEGDSWCSRTEGYVDDMIQRLPGTFIPY